MTLYGGIATPTVHNEASQFGPVLPWTNTLVVCYYGNTVWVLEPGTLMCVGVMTLGQKVLGGVTCGRDLYLLIAGHQRPLVKLSMPRPTQDDSTKREEIPEEKNKENVVDEDLLSPEASTLPENGAEDCKGEVITKITGTTNMVSGRVSNEEEMVEVVGDTAIVMETASVGDLFAEGTTIEGGGLEGAGLTLPTPSITVTHDDDNDDVTTNGVPTPAGAERQPMTQHDVIRHHSTDRNNEDDEEEEAITTGSSTQSHQQSSSDKSSPTADLPSDHLAPDSEGPSVEEDPKARHGMSAKFFTSTKFQVADLKGKLSQPLGKLKLGEGLRDGIREGIRDMAQIRKKPTDEEVEELPAVSE